MTYCTRYRSPLGEMVIAANDAGLIGVHFEGQRYFPDHVTGWRAAPEHAVIAAAQRQLDEYFAGCRASFDVPLVLRGTPFQRRVWEELRRIPFGETLTYSELAARNGAPRAARAVGAAVGRNPWMIIVPCHRALRRDGIPTLYAGGMERKRKLLAHEAKEITVHSHDGSMVKRA